MAQPDYPRPQLVRENLDSLDGTWSYAFTACSHPRDVAWGGDIQVPYPPESSLSGVNDFGYHPTMWYQRSFQAPALATDERLMLHFGAVDYVATVWLNGQLLMRHEGGHTPFSADITDALVEGEQILVLRAEDDPHQMDKPRGKQDWLPEPHGIWYPRTTGIWQSVWLERVSSTHIAKLKFTPSVSDFSITSEIEVAGDLTDVSLQIELSLGETLLVQDDWSVTDRRSKRTFHLPDPGIDNARQHYLWSPEHPTLFEVRLTLKRGQEVIDQVESYTALRSVELRDGKFHLNGRPYFLRLALDQGYWDESLLAAPNDEALKRDVELAKAMGFNGVRKHQKIEDPRYLYWADHLGLLVWEEMPSAYSFTPDAVDRLTREWLEVVERDYNHPCIVTWVCFNESWGVPDLPQTPEQRAFVRGLYHLTKALDQTRPVVGNDGWEHVVTDLMTVHDYSPEPNTLKARYHTPETSQQIVQGVLEHGRKTLLEPSEQRGQPIILSEFGGIRFHPGAVGWGYQQADSESALLEIYQAMIKAISGPGLAGFCYTQFADTFQEQNGLLYSDRRPKVELDSLAKATQGRG